MDHREITTENATPVPVVGKTPRTPVTADLPAYLQTAHRYAPALGYVAKKTSGPSDSSAKASVAKGAKS